MSSVELRIARLEAEMTDCWQLLCKARERGDWKAYWALRRSWLAMGRLHSTALEQVRAERTSQESLFDLSEGRRHDSPA